ncbi:hypothetical protein [Chondromyces crocatus]|uniref:Secreted protein n=1 Tax=Chondromyces crocatus TaxID=52 RepID=A0A0K1EKR9_CHOCO|nr:hypothetical protein [Chondromyces crocatus]AKT41257.1 uncharacterized protein CMC5_054240 [Chondromyces crocatus]
MRSSLRGLALLLALHLGACSEPVAPASFPVDTSSASAPLPPPEPPSMETRDGRTIMRLEGTVYAPPQEAPHENRKQFLGVLLHLGDGSSWVISQYGKSPFHDLHGVRMRVEGTPYEPSDQSLAFPHLSTEKMTLGAGVKDAHYVEIHGEQRIEGRFERHTLPEGSKLAGMKVLRFVDTQDQPFLVARSPLGDDQMQQLVGRPVMLTAFRVEPSRFIARLGGPYLWIREVHPVAPAP